MCCKSVDCTKLAKDKVIQALVNTFMKIQVQ
jgi:hypothetical protein